MICAGSELADFLPPTLVERYRLCSRAQALYWVHFPADKEQLRQALRHLKYEEFFRFQLVMQAIKAENRPIARGNVKHFSTDEVFALAKSLPFQLTSDQQQAIMDILRDLSDEKVMMRMLQGDVGCGKTMVAAFGLYACVLAHQAGCFSGTDRDPGASAL